MVRTAATLLAAALAVGAVYAQAPKSPNPYGEWRGHTQFKASVSGAQAPSVHEVVQMTIAIDPGGRVDGASSENGCRALGIARRLAAGAAVLTMDVTLSGCKTEALNRSYTGTLAAYSDGTATFDLSANQMGAGKVASFRVSASFRR